jgi:hypothetical protein
MGSYLKQSRVTNYLFEMGIRNIILVQVRLFSRVCFLVFPFLLRTFRGANVRRVVVQRLSCNSGSVNRNTGNAGLTTHVDKIQNPLREFSWLIRPTSDVVGREMLNWDNEMGNNNTEGKLCGSVGSQPVLVVYCSLVVESGGGTERTCRSVEVNIRKR